MELTDFPLVHQQPPGANWVFIKDIAFFVRRNVHAVYPQLSILNRTIGILEVQRTGPDGLHLCTRQLNSRLISVLHKIIMIGLAVLCRDFHAPFLREAHLPLLESFYSIAYFRKIRKGKAISLFLQSSRSFAKNFSCDLYLFLV